MPNTCTAVACSSGGERGTEADGGPLAITPPAVTLHWAHMVISFVSAIADSMAIDSMAIDSMAIDSMAIDSGIDLSTLRSRPGIGSRVQS